MGPVFLDDPERAAARLAAGEVVAFPTETVYGLGAGLGHPDAISRIFELKGRPMTRPLTLHVANADAFDRFGRDVPPEARALAERFWPGPLTIIVRRGPAVPDVAVAGGDTVGLRAPDHPMAMAMLNCFAELMPETPAVPAPSANRFGEEPPTKAEQVRDTWPDLPILDGGPCRLKVASTVLDLSGRAEVLRLGSLSVEAIAEVIGRRPTMA